MRTPIIACCRTLALGIGVLVASSGSAMSQSRLALDDLRLLVSLRSPAVSPDGKRVALIVARPDFERNVNVAELVVNDLATGRSGVVARGRAGVRDPVWVGNEKLAYAARGDSVDGRSQVFVQGVSGARSAAVQLTSAPTGVRSFAFAPDGSSLAYVSDDSPPLRTGEERHNDSFEVGNDDFLTMVPPQPAHLWLQPASGAARRLTSGAWSLSTSLSTTSVAWTSDGRSLVVQRFASQHSGDTDRSRIAVVDATTGATRFVADSGVAQYDPSPSPDGHWIAFTGARDGVPANMRDVMLVARDGGGIRNLTRGLDRSVAPQWLPDGELLLAGNDGTRISLWRMALTGEPRKIALGDVVALSGTTVADDGTIAFVGSGRGHPDELFVLPPGGTSPRRVTSYNASITARSLGETVSLEWSTTGGLVADGVVTYPPGFDPARRHPLVLYIHGGPTAASNEGFQARVQLLAARGWIVFQPNYRGSDNRGNAFQRAIADDPGAGIDADVMSGIAAVAARGGVDTARIAVSGWSFGGYVSAWLIGHHPDLKAAVVGAGAMDLFDMYALTDLNVQLRHAITASPYVNDREEWFRTQSPLTYASRVKTPTLILHDVRDQRVTITQSFKLYHALKDNGVPVQFIAYPVAGHSPTDPVRSRDVTRRWIEWLDRWLTLPTP